MTTTAKLRTAELGTPGQARGQLPALARLALHLLLIAGSLLVLLPFLVMLLVSLMPKEVILTRAFDWQLASLNNYFEIFEVVPFGRYYWNSLFVASATTLIQILTASLAAFAFARLRFRGRDALFLVYLATLMIPFQVTMIPNFILIRYLRWYDTYQALILPSAFSVFSTFLMRQYFMSVPLDLDEAARMDGAGSWRIWAQIIMPLAGPVLATLAIFNFQASWNDFLWPLVITNSQSMRTIPIGLSSFQGQFNTEWHLLMTGAVIALLPILIIYIIGQNWFVRGIAFSGLGGR
ncbi:MAG: carbohydrate ABC transporter permease [Caldilineaceae bacterium]|nr:carbohydrate ABC transporter permease [Caldilineaceae bacterium]